MEIRSKNDLLEIQNARLEAEKAYKYTVNICYGAGCVSSNCMAMKEALVKALKANGIENTVNLVETGCIGACHLGPSILVRPGDVYYIKVTPADADLIVREHFKNGRVVADKCYYDEAQEKYIENINEIDYFKKQTKIVLKNCGYRDHSSLEDYIASGGYMTLADILVGKTSQEVIAEMKKSGLRGRGGGGFSTGLKWELAARSKSDRKYVICNADEGDPGAFMDRSLLEGDPHSVIEGMITAGYAIGSNKGFVYVRAEYPLAVERLGIAIKKAREAGLLSSDILGSGFGFDIEIRIGAGAFVCGEETALMHSVEGKRGEPRQKPPFPSDEGLFKKPSIINNVETFANVPRIFEMGADKFASIGNEKSKGTKVFALAGAVKNTGIVEVPIGTSLGDIVFDIGGGVKGKKRFKAAQTGGPSGGCLTVSNLNASMDYDSLKALGAIMGSGGLICMDEDSCMVDIARFFMEFVQEESCGKCVPCRLGTRRMLEILQRITQGKGEEGDIDKLIELGETIGETAMCGLGQTAPKPVLSTIKNFREEYEEHIRNKRCRAGVCQALFISPCQNACPAGVNVPGYVALIAAGRTREAYNLIRKDNPFPAVCGRVCTHPCESKCRRGQLDEAIAIMDLKRFSADQVLKSEAPFNELRFPSKGKSVGIIGAGPSGLTCGYYLARLGYDVTIYESADTAGGMLVQGIPEYRLPRDVIGQEIRIVELAGVKILLNTEVGKDMPFHELRANHDSIYIATGTNMPNEMGIEGENLEGVYYGLDFLRDVNGGKKVSVGRKVAVIGGGSTAMDAARVALRLGAEEVHVFYRRSRQDMPADEREIEDGVDEGIVIHTMVNPIALLGSGKVERMRCTKLKPGRFDSSGRRRTEPIPGSEFEMEFDMVIPAVSQHSDLPFIKKDEVELTQWGTFVVNMENQMTKIPGVFAGGDVVRGPDTVIWAIADGKKAAKAIDVYLGGTGELNVGEDIAIPPADLDSEVKEHERFTMKMLPVKDRCGNFEEVSKGFHKLNAIAESMRCLRCDRR